MKPSSWVVLLCALAATAAAQTGKAPKQHVMTGCVAGAAGAYTITNGRYTHPVKITGPDNMGPHVGHTVQLKGTWSTDKKTFNETKVTMKSDSCSVSRKAKPKS